MTEILSADEALTSDGNMNEDLSVTNRKHKRNRSRSHSFHKEDASNSQEELQQYLSEENHGTKSPIAMPDNDNNKSNHDRNKENAFVVDDINNSLESDGKLGYEYEYNNDICLASADEEINDLHLSHYLQYNPLFPSRPMFPSDCLQIVRLMKGNKTCVDCNGKDDIDGADVAPMYASVVYGTLICYKCAKNHERRSKDEKFGVRSLTDDMWSFVDVLYLLEGGNDKFKEYCANSSIVNISPKGKKKSKTETINKENASKTFTAIKSASSPIERHRLLDDMYDNPHIKAYHKRLKAAVGRTQNDHEALATNQLIKRDNAPPKKSRRTSSRRRSRMKAKFIKDVPILSIHDFHTTILGKKWPLTEKNKCINNYISNNGNSNSNSNSNISISISISSSSDSNSIRNTSNSNKISSKVSNRNNEKSSSDSDENDNDGILTYNKNNEGNCNSSNKSSRDENSNEEKEGEEEKEEEKKNTDPPSKIDNSNENGYNSQYNSFLGLILNFGKKREKNATAA